MRRLALGVVACLYGMPACSIDWDRLDPRAAEAGSGGATTSSSAGVGGSGAGGMGGTGGVGGAGGTGGRGGGGGAGGAGVGGGGGAVVEYGASVADCIYIGMEDPDLCKTDPPLNHMTVDGDVSTYMLPGHSYLRFDLDDQLAGKTVTEVRLRLTVGADPDAESTSTGELFEVAPFTRMDLFTAAPMTVAPLGADQGAVVPNDTVIWGLPTTIVAPNGSVYLGVLPVVGNGVDYWNNDGDVPPALLVTIE